MDDYHAVKAEAVRLLGNVAVHTAKPLPPPEKKPIPCLQTYTADTLHDAILPRPLAIIDGFLVAGLSILAGAPKLGKSWLALWLSICVADGNDFLGMRCLQGDVLYLDLESRQYRVQERLKKLMNAKAPPGLHVAHEAASLDSGLIEQLEMWCSSVEKPRLIVIDIFARVKPRARYASNAYEEDYKVMSGLQSFALERGVAILLVHHLRKATISSGDPFERVSGSTGLVGAADAVYLLDRKRDETEGTLTASGRDFEEMSLAVQFDDGRWVCLGSDSAAYQQEKAFRESAVARGLLRLMSSKERWEGDATSLLNELYEMGIEPEGIYDAAKLGKELTLIDWGLKREGIELTRRSVKKGKKTVRTLILEKGVKQPSFTL